jgi:hypothetical protein
MQITLSTQAAKLAQTQAVNFKFNSVSDYIEFVLQEKNKNKQTLLRELENELMLGLDSNFSEINESLFSDFEKKYPLYNIL